MANIITLLITDDDEDDREFIITALMKENFDCKFISCENGADLISKLKAVAHLKAHTVLLDLNMPVMNGYEALKLIKRDPLLQCVPIIILTSSSKPDDEHYCYELGCNIFMRKPLSLTGYDSLADNIISFAKANANSCS
jgi:CheY-like chemotaxis protein